MIWDGYDIEWDGDLVVWDDESGPQPPRVIRPATIVKAQPATVAGEGTVE